jgi:hypothetical protein
MANNMFTLTLKNIRQVCTRVIRANSAGALRLASTTSSTTGKCGSGGEQKEVKKGKTPVGQLDDAWETAANKMEPQKPADAADPTKPVDPYAPFPDARNPLTGEIGGPRGPEPTRYGDWERKGRLSDF